MTNHAKAKFFHMGLHDAEIKKDASTSHLSVRGYFTTDVKDAVGDIITRTATEKAIPDYKKWGNIRYMHQPRPVGKVVKIGTDDGLEWNEVEFIVTKPDVSEDIENGLLSALSVGILVNFDDIDFLEDGGWIINAYKLAEISLVDHPANYGAHLKDMAGSDAIQYVQRMYTPAPLSIHKDEEPKEEPKKEKSPACRQEGETKDDCVSRKVPELMDEGMDQDQAVATANEMCSESCADKSLMEDTNMEKNLDVHEEPVDVVADEEPVVETVATDDASADKAIDETPEIVSEDVEVSTDVEKDIDGEEDNQDDADTAEEPVLEEKDITSEEEVIVEDEPANAGDDVPEWAESLQATMDRFIESVEKLTLAMTQGTESISELTEVSTEAEIEQVADGEEEDVEKGILEVVERAEPDVQKGAMPATELIENPEQTEEEVEKPKSLRDALMRKFNIE